MNEYISKSYSVLFNIDQFRFREYKCINKSTILINKLYFRNLTTTVPELINVNREMLTYRQKLIKIVMTGSTGHYRLLIL